MGVKENLYIANLKKLFPRGRAFAFGNGSESEALIKGISQEFVRADDSIDQLKRDLDPRTTYNLLEEYESFVQIPDDCQEKATDLSQRRSDVHRKLIIGGGQNAAFFKRLCSMFGYEVEVRDLHQFRVGKMRMGAQLWGPAFIHVWNIHAKDVAVVRFRMGQSTMGTPLGTWSSSILEAVVNRSKPAHTQVIFTYGGN